MTRAAYLALALTALLAVLPLVSGLGRPALAAAIVLTTGAAWRAREPSGVRLGVFVGAYAVSLLLGSTYSQLSFGGAILAYLLAVRRVPSLRGTVAWLRRGRFDIRMQAICITVALSAALGLLLWHAVARPDLGDLVDRFVPRTSVPILLLGGLLFSMVNAAVEEIAYRGVVLDALRDSGIPVGAAVGIQALAFGTIHLEGFPRGWIGVGMAALYGVVLGIIRLRADGMLAPWIAHVLTDLVIVGVVLAVA